MKSSSMRWLLRLVLLFSTNCPSHAQTANIRFENFSGWKGLPKNGVNCILQDKEGFMWIGTYEGLYRFDGHTATVFQHDPNNPENSLGSNLILSMREDRKGTLWVGTPVGLLRVDKRTGNATVHRSDSAKTMEWAVVRSILEDQQGILWLGTDRGISRFDPTTLKFRLYPSPTSQSLAHLHQDSIGNLWSSTYQGVCRFYPSTGKFEFFHVVRPDGHQAIPWSFAMEKSGMAWVGTLGDGLFQMDTRKPYQFLSYNPGGAVSKTIHEVYEASGYVWLASEGLQRINPKTNQIINYRSDDFQPGSLNNNAVSALYQDRMNNLWIGTSNGVSKAAMRTNPFFTYQLIPTPASFMRQENVINNILEDRDGTVWVGSDKKGLCRFDRKTGRMEPVIVNHADSRNTMTGQEWPLLEDRSGRLWVGTDLDKGLYVLDRRTDRFIRHDSEIGVRILAVSSTGTLWVGSDVEGIASFDPLTKRFTYYRPSDTHGIPSGTYVSALLASRTGKIWIATLGKGLMSLDPTTGKFTFYQQNNNISERINVALSLYEDEKGMIWIGTAEGGLNRLDPITQAVESFTTHQGLPSNLVASIIGDESGNLWLGTSQGLSRFNPLTLYCRTFAESDGLPDNYFRAGSVYRRNGKLFFGTRNGLVIFHPDSIKETSRTLPVHITSLKVNEKPVHILTPRIELQYDENFLSFDFTAINYDAPEKTKYAYQLVGLDPDWVHSAERRFARYTDLSSGAYTFRVKASENNQTWNEETSIQIIIHPPWWRTWWAYGLYGLLGVSFLFGLIHYSVSRERLQSDLKLQRLEAEKMHEIDHLKSQFFANISHEFRTPITLILGPLDKFLSRISIDNEDKIVYQTMQRNAKRLLHLINQLLDLSKLEAGKMQMETKPASIVTFLKTIVLSFTSLAERKQIHFHFKYPTENPVLYFDADKLEKILNNLLSNAFKFTSNGGAITVSAALVESVDQIHSKNVRTTSQTSKTIILELKVLDNGAGISSHHLSRIFDRFYQIDTSHTREHEGTGIGLALVRELVELHGGEVIAESQPSEGACFTVRLPLLAADFDEIIISENKLDRAQQSDASLDDAQQQVDNTSVTATEGAPLILIVEDNADIRNFIRENLDHDYKVIEAADGEQGYSLAVEIIPDLVLSDVMMPKMDGIEMCSRLKQNEKTDHIPVMLLTAKASGEDKIEGLETGVDDYIVKPFEAGELLVRIKNLIENRKKLRERFGREITLQPASITIPSRDEKFLQNGMQIVEKFMADSNFGVEKFCEEMGMSRMQLHRKFKALTDQSPGDFIRLMRLKRAADLLNRQVGNIAEVAYMVGFNDPSYFTKCFQKQFGKTPSEFTAQTMS